MKLSSLVMLVLLLGSTTANSQSGINYNYYEGTWNTLPDFNAISPSKTGVTDYINLNQRSRENNYAFLWKGNINIPQSGTYTFEIISDDGSKLYLGEYGYNTTPLISNDGLHGNQSRTATINLNAGSHPISFAYFQNGGNQTWEVYWWSNTGISRQKLPASVLSTSTTSAPPSGTPGLTYNYYEGNWSQLPDFNAISPKKSGTTTNTNLHPREREINYALLWKGYINVPATGVYTFETYSDDGSRLYIGDYNYNATPLINNDGLHGNQSRTASIQLTAGLHPIAMSYFQSGGGQTWLVYWSSNVGLNKQLIPDNAFTTSSNEPVQPAPQPEPVPEPNKPDPQPDPQPAQPEPQPEQQPNQPQPDPQPNPQPDPSGSGGLTGGTNYYFSSSNGDDNRSASQAQNPNTPWRSIGKLNSIFSTLKAGDAVLFNRGDVFEGSFNITRSGNSGSPIIFSSYGNGPKPIITGTVALSNWSNLGNNIWEAACNSATQVTLVTYNGVLQGMGRYPNPSAPEKGYLILESSESTRSITDNQLTGSTNWTGAEVVIRKNNWVLDRGLITSHNGNRINYNSPTGHEANPLYGYFIQNSPLTLDQTGEWYYNPNSKRLRIYSSNPNQNNIRASLVENVVTVENRNNITFDNISFQGGNLNALKIQSSQNIRVQNCDVNFSGTQGISGANSNNVVIENTSFNNTNNDAIELYNTSNSTIKGNYIINTGLIAGMGLSNNQQYEAIFIEGSNDVIEANFVENTGYSAITFHGEGALVKNNYINRFCLTLEDGGGIYGWGDMDKYNRKITGNIILNGIGSHEGTIYPFSTGASGVLIDDRTAHIEITDNTIAYCSRNGIYLHNSRDMLVKGNTIFDNYIQMSMVHDPIAPDVPVRGMTLNDNVIIAKTATQMVMELGSITNDIANFGSMNYNYYSRPINESGIISVNYRDMQGKTVFSFFDIEGWAQQYKYDNNTYKSPVKVPTYQINSYNGGNRFANASFNNNTSGISCQSAPGRCNLTWVNGRLDGGSAQVTFNQSGLSSNEVGTYVSIGSVQAGRHYLIKFTVLGANSGKTFKSFLLQDNGNYSRLSETKYFDLNNTRTEHEFLYSPTTNESGVYMALEINGGDIPFWLDNVQVYDVNASATNLDDYMHLEYNNSPNERTFTLNGNYVDIKNNRYNGRITLAPYSSAVLIRQSTTSSVDAVLSTATESAEISIAENNPLNLRVTPNPATRNIQVTVNATPEGQKSTMSIQSISGATLKTITLNGANQVVNVDVASWPKGVYMVNLYRNGKVINKKFVKQ